MDEHQAIDLQHRITIDRPDLVILGRRPIQTNDRLTRAWAINIRDARHPEQGTIRIYSVDQWFTFNANRDRHTAQSAT